MSFDLVRVVVENLPYVGEIPLDSFSLGEINEDLKYRDIYDGPLRVLKGIQPESNTNDNQFGAPGIEVTDASLDESFRNYMDEYQFDVSKQWIALDVIGDSHLYIVNNSGLFAHQDGSGNFILADGSHSDSDPPIIVIFDKIIAINGTRDNPRIAMRCVWFRAGTIDETVSVAPSTPIGYAGEVSNSLRYLHYPLQLFNGTQQLLSVQPGLVDYGLELKYADLQQARIVVNAKNPAEIVDHEIDLDDWDGTGEFFSNDSAVSGSTVTKIKKRTESLLYTYDGVQSTWDVYYGQMMINGFYDIEYNDNESSATSLGDVNCELLFSFAIRNDKTIGDIILKPFANDWIDGFRMSVDANETGQIEVVTTNGGQMVMDNNKFDIFNAVGYQPTTSKRLYFTLNDGTADVMTMGAINWESKILTISGDYKVLRSNGAPGLASAEHIDVFYEPSTLGYHLRGDGYSLDGTLWHRLLGNDDDEIFLGHLAFRPFIFGIQPQSL